MKLFELASKEIWHITEAEKEQSILQHGLRVTQKGIRGVHHADPSLFFITSLDGETMESAERIVRFGGVDFDDDEVMNRRSDTPLVLLQIDLQSVQEYDQEHHLSRTWKKDDTVEGGHAVFTNNPIPPQAIKVLRRL